MRCRHDSIYQPIMRKIKRLSAVVGDSCENFMEGRMHNFSPPSLSPSPSSTPCEKGADPIPLIYTIDHPHHWFCSHSLHGCKASQLVLILTLFCCLLLSAYQVEGFSIQGPFLSPRRASIPFEGFRSKGIISPLIISSSSFASPSVSSSSSSSFSQQSSSGSSAPESKFRDAISGYSVNLDEEEAKRLLRSKLSLYSSSLNVLDGHPEDTELAHSILLVHKKKPSVNTPSSASLATSASSTSTAYSSPLTQNASPTVSSAVPVVFSLLSSDPSSDSSFASPLNYYSTSEQRKPEQLQQTTATVTTSTTTTFSPSSETIITEASSTTSTVKTTDSTTTSSPSANPTVKFSAHTFKPFSVSSSLNYGTSLSSSLPSLASPTGLKLKLKTPPSSSASGTTLVFGNFTQISSFDPTFNPNRPTIIVNSHKQTSGLSPSKLAIWSQNPSTKRRPVFASTPTSGIELTDEEDPVVVHSNHRKSFLSRQKVTSAADSWTTPSSFTEVPTRTSPPPRGRPTIPTTLYPPYTTSVTSKGIVSTPSPPSAAASGGTLVFGNYTQISSLDPTYNPDRPAPPPSRPPLKVTAVHSNRHKAPERIASGAMTVLDSKGNVTIVHQKLIVPYKPGRPKPGVSSVGIIQAPAVPSRPKPNTTESGEVIDSDEAEATTYYPTTKFKPTTPFPTRPWTCEPICGGSSSETTMPTTTRPTTTTKDPYVVVESAHNIATRRPPFQPATVNAILAPPMPSRPISTPAPIGNTGIISSLLGVLGFDSTGSLMSRLTLFKTALFTLLVMFLPPLTLAAAVAQLL